jgi:uncharacterized RDD family membrane protein YckC
MATSNAPLGLAAHPRDAPAAVRADAPTAAGHSSYAGLVTRSIAFAIDAALINVAALAVAAVVALVLSIFPTSHHMRSLVAAVGGVVFAIWVVAYFVTFWTTTRETPGCHVMRIRVLREDGSPLRARHALLRFAGLILGLPLFVGYVPILLNDRRRGLQDVMAGTVVVNAPEEAH